MAGNPKDFKSTLVQSEDGTWSCFIGSRLWAEAGTRVDAKDAGIAKFIAHLESRSAPDDR